MLIIKEIMIKFKLIYNCNNLFYMNSNKFDILELLKLKIDNI